METWKTSTLRCVSPPITSHLPFTSPPKNPKLTQTLASQLLIDTKKLLLALRAWIRANPKQFTAICIGVILLALACATPAILDAIGFSAVGPVAESIAAGWQASMGTVAAGSIFAFLQSAAMGGAAIGLFTGVGAVGGLVALVGVGASMKFVKEKVSEIGGVVSEKFVEVGEVIKDAAVQAGGAVAAGAVQVGRTVGEWWGGMTRKMKGE